jgi:hypothetical protein
MVKKPNYGQERAQRARVQQERQREKLQKREEESLKRKAAREGDPKPNLEPND